MKILFLINKFKLWIGFLPFLALAFKVWMGNCFLEAVDLSFGRGFLLRWGDLSFGWKSLLSIIKNLKTNVT